MPAGPLCRIFAPLSLAVRVVPPAKATACSTVRPLAFMSNAVGLPTSPTTYTMSALRTTIVSAGKTLMLLSGLSLRFRDNGTVTGVSGSLR